MEEYQYTPEEHMMFEPALERHGHVEDDWDLGVTPPHEEHSEPLEELRTTPTEKESTKAKTQHPEAKEEASDTAQTGKERRYVSRGELRKPEDEPVRRKWQQGSDSAPTKEAGVVEAEETTAGKQEKA